ARRAPSGGTPPLRTGRGRRITAVRARGTSTPAREVRSLDREAVRAHPIVGVELRDVGLPAVGEDGDDHLALAELLGELDGHGHRAAGGAAGEDALLTGEAARPGEAGLVV